MKLLFITNLYSGLKKSFQNKEWLPEGMPAIYKLLEFLSANKIIFNYIFFDSKENSYKEIKFDTFPGCNFSIINSKDTNSYLKITDQYFNNRNKFNLLTTNININNYDIIYLDRANVGLIPFIKKEFRGKIILRLHGVLNYYQLFSSSLKFKLINWFLLYSFKRKIDCIIGTKDGSSINLFLENFLHPQTKYFTLLNGVDLYEKLPVIHKDNTITYLVIGRLENDKGILDIVNVFEKLNLEFTNSIKLIIIGEGSLKEKIYNRIGHFENIEMYNSIPHKKIKDIYDKVDVVISLNLIGNISNVILEAISFNKAIITLKEDKSNFYDIESNDFLKSNVMYVDRSNIKSDLYKIISNNKQNVNSINKYKELVEKNLRPLLLSWDSRIKNEVDIIKSILKK